MLLECGHNLVLSAVPSATIYRNQTRLKAYYCSEHRDYFPTMKALGKAVTEPVKPE